jgi:hypothetical protein
MIFIYTPFLAILITYAKTWPRQSPVNGTLITGNITATTFQAPFVRERNASFTQLVTTGGTNIDASVMIARLAYIISNSDMDILVNIKFINR